MHSFPWLTTIGVVPLVGALVVLLMPRSVAARAKVVALGFSLATLVVAVLAATQYDIGSGEQFQLTELHRWIPQIGTSYSLGVDGLALVMVLLSVVLTPICLLAAWHDVPQVGRREQNYFALMLVLETMMVGVFVATDLFLFYVFFEAMLVPVYFLIGSFGGPQRHYAAVKFLLYSLLGGLLMLVAVIALYVAGPGGEQGFLVSHLTGLDLGVSAGRWMFLGFFVAFAIKAPMFPVHTWLPDAAAEAPPPTAVLLVGVLDKVGTFGMLRFCLPMFPEASKWATPAIVVLALVSIVYGALLAIGQTDLMRLIAYTSVSHFGFIVLGVFAMTSPAQNGSALYMVNHGISTAALFLVAAMLASRRGSQRIPDFGGWQRVTPVIAGVFLVAGMSSLSLPGLNNFISEFLVLIGTFARYPAAGVVATVGIILAAVYILLMYQRMMTGPKPENTAGIRDLSLREAWVVAPLVIAMVGLGVYPKPVLDVVSPTVKQTMTQVGVTDPAPVHGTPVAEGSAK